MKVKFQMDVTWSDRSCKKDEEIELGDALAKQFIDRGFCHEVKAPVEEIVKEDDKPVVKISNSTNKPGGKPGRGKKSVKG